MIEVMKKRNKTIIISIMVALLLVLITSVTYAILVYSKSGTNQLLVAGDVYLKYTEGVDTINIVNAMPASTYNEEEFFEFTIEGKNTFTKPIYYEIVISHGDELEDRHTRIPDEFLSFRLTEQLPGGEETEVIQEGNYSDFASGKSIWVNTVAAGQKENTKVTYKLYMWVSDEMHLGSGDDVSISDMDMEKWAKDAYASVKVTVDGDFNVKHASLRAVEKIKSSIGTFGGVTAVVEKEDSVEAVTEKKKDINAREYRFSGNILNNHVYFNCKASTTYMNAKENCEIWRIIGVFKDEKGKEHIKLVRNEKLLSSAYPTTYTSNGETFSIKGNTNNTAYWDQIPYRTAFNNWEDSGLKHWLNSDGEEGGYYNSLSETSKNMIEDATYYLGNVTGSDSAYTEYKNERNQTLCPENVKSLSDQSNCYVWYGNSPTWTGKISLMQLSDYLFAFDSSSWNSVPEEGYSSIKSQNWLNVARVSSEWLLSPTHNKNSAVSVIFSSSNLNWLDAVNSSEVRPVVTLKSSVLFSNGNGSSADPYLFEDDTIYEKASAVTTIKNTLGQSGGIIGVTNNNAKTTSLSDEIREYRYSGLNVNNYIYFNCKDNNLQSSDNCEVWRILGIFKDEKGDEHLKIVYNNVLSRSTENMPALTYLVNGKVLNLKSDLNLVTFYWDKLNNSNDWSTAVIQYWLNSKGSLEDGFFRSLSINSQNMIADTKYYLGSLTSASNVYIDDTPAQAYKYERAVSGCIDNKGLEKNTSKDNIISSETCRVWANKAASWTGKIGLMYPSDYGFSADSQYWNTKLGKGFFEGTPASTSWIYTNANFKSQEWLLNPNTAGNEYATILREGRVSNMTSNDAKSARPTAYLKKDVVISSGSGSATDPYQLAYEKSNLVLTSLNGKIPVNGEITFTARDIVGGVYSVSTLDENIAQATAKINNGNSTPITVKGLKPGTTSIKVTHTPANKVYDVQTAYYTITITNEGYATDTIKATLGKEKGIIGVTRANTKVTIQDDSIREYRYSGANVNNYVYFNCKDNEEQNKENCETWRIIGIFRDDNKVETIKITRNDVISVDQFPEKYTYEDEDYLVKGHFNDERAYWNGKENTRSSDWSKASLNYWLNSAGSDVGYLKTLSGTSQKMIAKTKYRLGLFQTNMSAGVSYRLERGGLSCSSDTSCNPGYVWKGNSATWEGEIALMYPSDVGFSFDSSYWNTKALYDYYLEDIQKSGWMKEMFDKIADRGEWLLSPSTNASDKIGILDPNKRISLESGVVSIRSTEGLADVRPTLHLVPTVKIINGIGSAEDPYQLELK